MRWLIAYALCLTLLLGACVGTLLYIVAQVALQPPAMTVAPCSVRKP